MFQPVDFQFLSSNASFPSNFFSLPPTLLFPPSSLPPSFPSSLSLTPPCYIQLWYSG